MGWTHQAVLSQIRATIAKHADGVSEADLRESTELVAELGIDSLGVMEVVADIEDKFELVIADSELREVATLGDVVKVIVDQLRMAGRLDEKAGRLDEKTGRLDEKRSPEA